MEAVGNLDGIPSKLVNLFDGISDEQFIKMLAHRSRNIVTVPNELLKYVDYIMYKMGDIAKRVRFTQLPVEQKMKIIELMSKEGADPSMLFVNHTKDVEPKYHPEKLPVTPATLVKPEPEPSPPPTLFQSAVNPSDILPSLGGSQISYRQRALVKPEPEPSPPPTLFQDAVYPSDILPPLGYSSQILPLSQTSETLRISFRNEPKSFNKHSNIFESLLEDYETESYENESPVDEPDPNPTCLFNKSKNAIPQAQRKHYRESSPSPPPRSYRSENRAKSWGRSRSRSRSGSPTKSTRYRPRSRSKSRGRYGERSRSQHRDSKYY